MLRVAVVLGGTSSERQVSLNSGKVVLENLPKDRYVAKPYDPMKDLDRFIRDIRHRRIDLVFNALHGKGGEDGAIQGMLEFLGVPYTGSGIMASSIAIDKYFTKHIYREAQIPTPPSLMLNDVNQLSKISKNVGKEIVIKPLAEGSSVGVVVKPQVKDWPIIIKSLLKAHGACLVERYIDGRELTVGVLGAEALPVIEIRTKQAFFDYTAKYEDASTEELCPAPIDDRIAKEAQDMALEAHKALGCRVYSRTDIILDSEQKIWVLETNTLPGLTNASLLPKAAAAIGLSMSDLLDRIIQLSYERH